MNSWPSRKRFAKSTLIKTLKLKFTQKGKFKILNIPKQKKTEGCCKKLKQNFKSRGVLETHEESSNIAYDNLLFWSHLDSHWAGTIEDLLEHDWKK